MRWTRSLAISAGILVGLLAVLLLILFNMDLGRFKDDAERYFSRATGREVVIGGEFQASLGRTVALRAEDLRVANADWSTNPDMLQVGEFELRVNLWSLFVGPVWIQHLKLGRTRVFVEANSDEQINWTFDPRTDASKWLAGTHVGERRRPSRWRK